MVKHSEYIRYKKQCQKECRHDFFANKRYRYLPRIYTLQEVSLDHAKSSSKMTFSFAFYSHASNSRGFSFLREPQALCGPIADFA